MIREKKNLPRIFIISGPSGSGKTTLLKNLLKDRQLRGTLIRSVSLTTRPRRSAERQGKDYFFISRKEFFRRQKAEKILEWTKYLGYFYATPRDFVESQIKKKRNIILCLDYKGVLQIKRRYRCNTVTIFIMPPSIRALMRRIKGRRDRTKEEEILRRLKLAREELLSAGQYDYCIINKSLSLATKKLKDIILKEI